MLTLVQKFSWTILNDSLLFMPLIGILFASLKSFDERYGHYVIVCFYAYCMMFVCHEN